MTHTPGHHRHVIDVRISHHCFKRIFSVARGEFKLHMVVPLCRERLLSGSKSRTSKMADKEFETSEIGQLSIITIVVFSSESRDG